MVVFSVTASLSWRWNHWRPLEAAAGWVTQTVTRLSYSPWQSVDNWRPGELRRILSQATSGPGQAEELTPAPRPSEPVTSESPRHADSRQTQRSAEESTEAARGYTLGNIHIWHICRMSQDFKYCTPSKYCTSSCCQLNGYWDQFPHS